MVLRNTQWDSEGLFFLAQNYVSRYLEPSCIRSEKFIHESTTLNLSPNGSHVLVGQVGGRARLVSGRQCGNRGAVEVSYLPKEQLQQLSETHSQYPGAVFAAAGQTVIFGSVEGCVLVWDKTKATVSYGLEHDKGECGSMTEGERRFSDGCTR